MRDARNGRSKGFRPPLPVPACPSLGRPLPPPAPLRMTVASPPPLHRELLACLVWFLFCMPHSSVRRKRMAKCSYCICRRPESGEVLPSEHLGHGQCARSVRV